MPPAILTEYFKLATAFLVFVTASVGLAGVVAKSKSARKKRTTATRVTVKARLRANSTLFLALSFGAAYAVSVALMFQPPAIRTLAWLLLTILLLLACIIVDEDSLGKSGFATTILLVLLLVLQALEFTFFEIQRAVASKSADEAESIISAPVPVASPGFRERLYTAGSLVDPALRSVKRADVLVDWITTDFNAAYSFLKAEEFVDLMTPSVARTFAQHATVEHLIAVAADGTLAYDLLISVGRHLAPGMISDLGAAIEKAPQPKRDAIAAVVAALIASNNLDSALRYANDTPANNQASAYASILDTMVSNNGKDEALKLYQSLPEDLRNSDLLLFSAGKAFGADDPMMALGLLSQIQDVTIRKTAIVSYSRTIESRSPEAAIMAVNRAGLSNAGADAHSQRIFMTWLSHDREAATAFARNSAMLSDGQRDTLLKIATAPSD